MSETGLKLIVADLVIARVALRTSAAPAHERNGYAVSYFPFCYVFANRLNSSCQLVSWNMGDLDTVVMSDPAVPVASANTGSHDFDNDAMRLWRRVRHVH